MQQCGAPLALGVQRPAAGVAVVRVAGDLTGAAAARLGRVLLAQIEYCAATPPGRRVAATPDGRSCLLVDLEAVRCFGEDGLSVLVDVRAAATCADVAVHVSGLAERMALLPERVAALLARFPGHTTLDSALSELVCSCGARASSRIAVPRPRSRADRPPLRLAKAPGLVDESTDRDPRSAVATRPRIG